RRAPAAARRMGMAPPWPPNLPDAFKELVAEAEKANEGVASADAVKGPLRSPAAPGSGGPAGSAGAAGGAGAGGAGLSGRAPASAGGGGGEARGGAPRPARPERRLRGAGLCRAAARSARPPPAALRSLERRRVGLARPGAARQRAQAPAADARRPRALRRPRR